ncbi:COBW domain-containing protein 1, partial [Cucurbita argyrosperma subsp. argyrosperma]
MNMRIELGTTQKRKEHKVFRDEWVCMCCSHPCLIFQQVRSWLEEILWDRKGGMDVYRCKGVLSIKNSDQLHTLQAVRELYEIVPTRQWNNGESQMNKIVFIGRNLSEDVLSETFRACAVS